MPGSSFMHSDASSLSGCDAFSRSGCVAVSLTMVWRLAKAFSTDILLFGPSTLMISEVGFPLTDGVPSISLGCMITLSVFPVMFIVICGSKLLFESINLLSVSVVEALVDKESLMNGSAILSDSRLMLSFALLRTSFVSMISDGSVAVLGSLAGTGTEGGTGPVMGTGMKVGVGMVGVHLVTEMVSGVVGGRTDEEDAEGTEVEVMTDV